MYAGRRVGGAVVRQVGDVLMSGRHGVAHRGAAHGARPAYGDPRAGGHVEDPGPERRRADVLAGGGGQRGRGTDRDGGLAPRRRQPPPCPAPPAPPGTPLPARGRIPRRAYDTTAT